jgi:hypothetical protein
MPTLGHIANVIRLKRDGLIHQFACTIIVHVRSSDLKRPWLPFERFLHGGANFRPDLGSNLVCTLAVCLAYSPYAAQAISRIPAEMWEFRYEEGLDGVGPDLLPIKRSYHGVASLTWERAQTTVSCCELDREIQNNSAELGGDIQCQGIIIRSDCGVELRKNSNKQTAQFCKS